MGVEDRWIFQFPIAVCCIWDRKKIYVLINLHSIMHIALAISDLMNMTREKKTQTHSNKTDIESNKN